MPIFLIEASHLFRSGDKFQTQFFVMDVVNFLRRKFYNNTEDFKVIVLHGSVKNEQADRYTSALERQGVKVVRMKPIVSTLESGKHYFKPTWYMHKMMGNEIPTGSEVMMVGFHNIRYESFLKKYYKEYRLAVASFITPSKHHMMGIPPAFFQYVQHAINLDDCVVEIKAEFKGGHSAKTTS